jgi:hypothetical protein
MLLKKSYGNKITIFSPYGDSFFFIGIWYGDFLNRCLGSEKSLCWRIRPRGICKEDNSGRLKSEREKNRQRKKGEV